jgi:flavin-binding protein dodecin
MAVVKIIDLVGESPDSWEAAAMNLVAEAKATLRGITRIGIASTFIHLGLGGPGLPSNVIWEYQ